MRKFLTAIAIVTAVAAPSVYAATRSQAGSAPQQEETIICPLTGEEIKPCCCPLGDEKK